METAGSSPIGIMTRTITASETPGGQVVKAHVDRDARLGSIFQVHVQELRNDKEDGHHVLSVRWFTSVKDIKDMLHKKICVQPRFQELYYGTSKLSNSSTLHDLKIEESGKCLRLVIVGQASGRFILTPASTGSATQFPIKSTDMGREELMNEVLQGFQRGNKPISTDALDCTGGVYFLTDGDNHKCAVFKPFDEEQGMQLNNKGHNAEGLRSSFSPGQGCIRELAAYILDKDGFAGVPETMLVECAHKAFSYPMDERGRQGQIFPKLGSLQRFIVYQHLFEDIGTSNLSDFEVQKIALLDMRLLNSDRNASNILVLDRDANFINGGSLREHKYGRRYDRSSSITSSEADWRGSDFFELSEDDQSAYSDSDPDKPRSRRNTRDLTMRVSKNREHYILVPIDHGYTLPTSLLINEYDWVWFHMSQVKRPVDPEIKEYILGLDFDTLAKKLQEQVAVTDESLFLLRLSHNLIVNGIKAGLTLHDIAKLIARVEDDVPSPLERTVAVAEENAHRAIEMRSGRLDSRSIPFPISTPTLSRQSTLSSSSTSSNSVSSFCNDNGVGGLLHAITKPDHPGSPRSRLTSNQSSPRGEGAGSPISMDSPHSTTDLTSLLATAEKRSKFNNSFGMPRRVNSGNNLLGLPVAGSGSCETESGDTSSGSDSCGSAGNLDKKPRVVENLRPSSASSSGAASPTTDLPDSPERPQPSPSPTALPRDPMGFFANPLNGRSLQSLKSVDSHGTRSPMVMMSALKGPSGPPDTDHDRGLDLWRAALSGQPSATTKFVAPLANAAAGAGVPLRKGEEGLSAAVNIFPSITSMHRHMSPRRVVSGELDCISPGVVPGSEHQRKARPSSAGGDKDKPPPDRSSSGRILRRKISKGAGNNEWGDRAGSPSRYDADAEVDSSDEVIETAFRLSCASMSSGYEQPKTIDMENIECLGQNLNGEVQQQQQQQQQAIQKSPLAKPPLAPLNTDHGVPAPPAFFHVKSDLSSSSLMRVTSFSSFASEPIYDEENTSDRRSVRLNRERRKANASKPEFREMRQRFAEQRLAVLLRAHTEAKLVERC